MGLKRLKLWKKKKRRKRAIHDMISNFSLPRNHPRVTVREYGETNAKKKAVRRWKDGVRKE